MIKRLVKSTLVAVLVFAGIATAGPLVAPVYGATAGTVAAAGGCVDEPALAGASKSPLYTVTADGAPLFVEKMTKFAPEPQVHYAHCSILGSGTARFSVTVGQNFNSYTVSPKSRKLAVTRSGNTITFDSGPNYLVVQFDSAETLFILIDAPESGPPALGDANVKNLADYGVDNTGATLVTAKIQSAVNAASGATRNILYVPAGRYQIGELWMKSNMTLYLAAGAVLYGSNRPADFNTGSGGVNIEGMQHSTIRMLNISNSKILGRGVIDGNGKSLRAQGINLSVMKIEQSSNILIDGITVRDSSYWNTLVYRSNQVTIKNYKLINCRPASGYNNTDGVDFDESTDSLLSNAFLYTGDDNMATKNEDATSGYVNTKNVVHEHVVCYSNSACAKIGTKNEGSSMDGVVFRDIDVVKAGRSMVIDAVDTAVISNTRWENVRVENTDSMIDLEEDRPPSWRTVKNTSTIRDAYFTNVSSDVKKVVNLHGRSSSVNINGVHFTNFTVQGQPVTSQTDADASWNINSYVSNITFATAQPTTPPPTSVAPTTPVPTSVPPTSGQPTTTAPTTTAPTESGQCEVGYAMNSWNNGFTTSIHIVNRGTSPIEGWTLAFTLPSGQSITSGWNATYTGSSGQITARNASYNASLPVGGSTDIGFQATHSGNTSEPASFTLNGVNCLVS
jgi:Cellulose binding domain/Glycosyl hydrolases family 28